MEQDRAELIIQFIETLRVPDGKLAGRQLKLSDEQKTWIRAVYTRDEYDERIVNQCVLTIARKNGKTAFLAGLLLVHLCGPEAVRNGQLYSIAFDREQAGIVFRLAAAMVRMDADLDEQLNIIDSRKTIIDPVSGSRFESLSSEARGHHGKSSSFIVFDELAQFGADRELYDVMMTSTGAHGREALTWVISTQAANDTALLSDLVDYGRKVEAGEIDDPTMRCFYYAVEADDDPWDEENWYKANPHLGQFRDLEEMRITAEKAKRIPSAEIAFRNLYLNQRINASDYFLTPAAWKRCGGKVDLETLRGEQAWLGVDLSGKNDLTALIAIIPKEVDDVTHYFAVPYFFVPGDNLQEKEDADKVPYRAWAAQGLLEARPGKTINYKWVAKKIIEISREYELVNIGFDRWRIDDLVRELDDLGHDFEMTPIGQGFKDMNPCLEILEDAVHEETLHHGDHPVLTWNIANTVIVRDPAGSRKFAKNKARGRIDGTVALAMALRTCITDLEVGSVYDSGHELLIM